MQNNIAEKVQQAQLSAKNTLRTKMFDIIAVLILIVLISVSLGVIERRIITLQELGNIVVECIPFFLAFILLGDNYYMKGTYTGKITEKFISASLYYSDILTSLSDEEMSTLEEFCDDYNNDALRRLQESYLRRAAISYKLFNEGDEKTLPLKTWTDKDLKNTYGKQNAKWIILAKKATIKGLKVNILTGTNSTDDITDVGYTEGQLLTNRRWRTTVNYAISTICMALIAVKDIMSWNWFGFALVVFKCVFIFCKAYVEYFSGYNDVTIHLVSHINRKSDIFKHFRHWFSVKYASNGNKLEND
jgi:hypothetical protein